MSALPPPTQFKRFDVRPLLAQGRPPLPAIMERLAQLKDSEGLLVVAPFLPSPLIEMMQGEGFQTRVDHVAGAECHVYFWK